MIRRASRQRVRPKGRRGPSPAPAFVATVFIALAIVAIPLMGASGSASPGSAGALSPSPTPAPNVAPAAPASPSPAPAPTMTPTPAPDRCVGLSARLSHLRADVTGAMDEYDGAWGFALYDLGCESLVTFPLGYVQYPASSSKIVIVIAALRAVEDGLIDFEEIEGYLELVLHLSLDAETDAINAYLEPGQIAEVLEIAGVSELVEFEQEWRDAVMGPADLALVWAALLRGDLLTTPWTDHVLRLASEAVFPEGFETFPEDLGVPGYQYGQKAGYWVSGDEDDVFVGSGYIRPLDRSHPGFALVLMVMTPMDDVFEEQRRSVFPILREFVLDEVERARRSP